jgi:signal transduction histidine kinase
VFFLTYQNIVAQRVKPILTPDGQWLWYNYTTENGLLQNSVTLLQQDNDGIYWFGTQDGLVRFDGQKVISFSTGKLKGFEDNRITLLAKIPNSDTILVGSFSNFQNGKLAYCYRGNLFFDKSNTLTQKYYININGKISLRLPFQRGMEHGNGLLLRNKGKTYFYHAKFLEKNNRHSLFINDEYGKVLQSYDLDNVVPYKNDCLVQDSLLYFFYDKYHYKLFDGERCIKSDVIRFEKGEIPSDIASGMVYEDTDGQRYFFTNTAIYNLYFENKTWLAKPFITNLPKTNIWFIHQDTLTKQFLVGTSTKGLWIFKRKYYKQIMFDKMSSGISSVVEYADNKVAAAMSDYVVSADLEKNTPPTTQFFPSLQQKNNYWRDKNGQLWGREVDLNSKTDFIGYYENNDFGRFQKVNKSDLFFGRRINYIGHIIFMDDPVKDEVWIFGRLSVGIVSKNATYKQIFNNTTIDEIFAAVSDNNGKIYIGSFKGLFILDTKTNTITEEQRFSQKVVRALYFDKEQNLWIGTYGQGFYLLKNNVLTSFPLDKAARLQNTHAFVEDENNNFWITTNNGIFKIRKESLLQYAENKQKLPNYYYEPIEGLAINEFNGGSTSPLIRLKNGTIVGAAMEGIIALFPSLMTVNKSYYAPFLDKINIKGQDTILTDKRILTLPHDFERISFSLVHAYFGIRENYHLEYRLAGFDNDWISWNFDEKIIYTDLPPGDFSLDVRLIVGDAVDYKYYNLQKITILKPWYWSNLAIITYLGLFGFFILSYIRRRTYKVEKQNRILQEQVELQTLDLKDTILQLQNSEQSLKNSNESKEKVINIIAHDMKTPLLFMERAAAMFVNELDELDSETIKEFLKEVHKTNVQLHSLLVATLDWVQSGNKNLQIVVESIDLKEIINNSILLYEQSAKMKNIKFETSFSSDTAIVGDKKWLQVLLNNLIENSVKFSKNAPIRVEVTPKDGHILRLKIQDFGQGIASALLEKLISDNQSIKPIYGTDGEIGFGLGFSTIKNIVKKHRAMLLVTSKENEGTTIEIDFTKNLSLQQ